MGSTIDRSAPVRPGEELPHDALRDYLSNYLMATWNEYFNPEVYRDAELDDPYGLKEHAFQQPGARAHRREVTASCIRYLLAAGILSEEPAL